VNNYKYSIVISYGGRNSCSTEYGTNEYKIKDGYVTFYDNMYHKDTVILCGTIVITKNKK